jgi:uncharacterized membrane protein YsdA (DUF1294 family)/cold shock CspA family protein
MSTYGVLKTWDEERGFGFIEPAQGGKDIFVPLTAFAPGSKRPQVKQRVRFEIETGPDGRQQARQVEAAMPTSMRSVSRDEAAAHWTMAMRYAIPAFLGLYLLLALVWHVPSQLAVIYLAASAITFGAHAMDKYASKRGLRRTSESTLHAFSLLGGWPGTLLAHHFVRHKSTKTQFRKWFWITVVINVIAFVLLCSPLGQPLWR